MCVSVRKDSREKSAKQVTNVAWQPSVSTGVVLSVILGTISWY